MAADNPTDTSATVLCELLDGIARITLYRPERHNAFDDATSAAPGAVLGGALELALSADRRIASRAMIKQIVDGMWAGAVRSGLGASLLAQAARFRSNDRVEAKAAARERRAPAYSGI